MHFSDVRFSFRNLLTIQAGIRKLIIRNKKKDPGFSTRILLKKTVLTDQLFDQLSQNFLFAQFFRAEEPIIAVHIHFVVHTFLCNTT